MVDSAVASGSVVVAAAGNEGGPCNGNKGGISTPGSAPLAITVGAVDRNGRVTCYSSRGGPIDDLLKPEVVAPGGGVLNDGKAEDA